MCALISMAVYCTEKNKRDDYLFKTLMGLSGTVNFERHTLGVSINGFTNQTISTLDYFKHMITHQIFNDTNIGTAEAVNKIWKLRKPGEHCVKMDDDCYIHEQGWLDQMEEVVAIDLLIGQCGLKRTDLWENVYHDNLFYRTTLYQLPHKTGERWHTVETTNHCIGTCVLHSSALLDKIGYLKQPYTYGLDDTLMSKRSLLAGFKNVFLPNILIDHLDVSPPKEWTEEKNSVVDKSWTEYNRLVDGYENGTIPLYYNPFL